MKKRMLAMLLTCVMVLAVGCGGGGDTGTGGESGAGGNGNILYYAYNTGPYINLDPSVEYSNGIIVLNNVYETLTRYDYHAQELVPMIAESWTSNEDGTNWVFQIRPGMTFHDGDVVDALAVKQSIDRTREMNLGAAFIWDAVNEIEVTGEYEVTFHLDYSAPIDMISSAGYAAYIMSPTASAQDSEWFNDGNDGGSGPYRIMRITAGEEVVFAQFEDYWQGWSEGQFENAIIKKVAEGSARRQLLEKGEAHIADRFSVTDLNALRETDGVVIQNTPSWRNVVGFFNTEREPLDNADFRRALAYAFPYEEVVDEVLEGQGVQSYGLVPPGLWGHSTEVPQYTFDMEKAQEYLDKSGVDPTGITLEMTFTTGAEAYRNFSQLYQINLKQLGIDLEIREMNWDSVWEKAKNTNPEDRQDLLFLYWWPDYASPFGWFASLVHSEDTVNFNLSYIDESELDALIDEAALNIASDRDKAEELLLEVQKRIVDEAYYLHVYDDIASWVVNENLKGFDSNPAYEGVVYFYDLSM